MTHETCDSCGVAAGQPASIGRRDVLLGAGVAALAVIDHAHADDGPDPNAALPPQIGDMLIQANGMQMGQPITTASFTAPDTVIQAWPKDPKTGVLRNKSRLNRVLLIKVDPAALAGDVRQRSVEGVIAYSDFCTHAGCFIETYHPSDKQILCHCHGSIFDPFNDARVIGGPARGPLAGLALKTVDGKIAVAAPFDRQPGIPKSA